MIALLSVDIVEAGVALAVVTIMFVAFFREWFPPDVIAIGAVAVLLASGLLPTDSFVDVFANGAPVAIGALFILSGALIQTGVVDRLGEVVVSGAKVAPVRTAVMGVVALMVASAFLNNTPVVMVMIPVVLQFAAASGWASSRLLIPLSYVAILGGSCTLIGTSTNLLVDGVAQASGLAPFGMFEMTAVAGAVALAGALFIAFSARTLLPDRRTLAEFSASSRRKPRFFTEIAIPAESPLVGENPLSLDVFADSDVTVIDVLRGDASLRRSLDAVTLRMGDRVVLRTSAEEVMDLRERGLSVAGTLDPVSLTGATTAEVLVPPGSRFVGRMLGRLRLRRRFGVYPLALHRRGEAAGAQLDTARLQVGDTLLIEGAPDDIARLVDDAQLVSLARGEGRPRPPRRRDAPLAIAVMLGVVLVSALGILPIAGASIIGVAVILLSRVMAPEEAFAAIDGRLLALVIAMLAVGRTLEETGAIALLVEALTPVLAGAPPLLALVAVFVLTAMLTEAVTNNAVAVVMTPLAIALAQSLGQDPRGFVMAVMIAANSSFATPISYQTNMLVYAPGGYRFSDFIRLGLPLKVVTAAVAILMISTLGA